MDSNSLDSKEIKKEIRRLRYNVKRRLERIAEISRERNLPTLSAQKRFTELSEKYPTLKNLTEKELIDYLRDLKYINKLKSSSIKSITDESTTFMNELKDKLKSLSQEKQSTFWDIYGKLYDESPTYERYKYDILQTVDRLFFMGTDAEYLIHRISEMYKDVIIDLGRDATDSEIATLFYDKLSGL